MLVIITGGTRGIGKACCEVFKREGWDVVATSSKEDVRDYNLCKEVVNNTLKKYGRIDALVNNAGVIKDKPFISMTLSEWDDVIKVSLYGTFNMTKTALPTMMRQGRGSIINMASVSGITGLARQVNYGAAKAGVIGFTRALAREIAPFGVTVNAIAAGMIDTDMTKAMSDNLRETIKCAIPARKIGSAQEVAELAHFLASDRARYITGDVVRIDGGFATGAE